MVEHKGIEAPQSIEASIAQDTEKLSGIEKIDIDPTAASLELVEGIPPGDDDDDDDGDIEDIGDEESDFPIFEDADETSPSTPPPRTDLFLAEDSSENSKWEPINAAGALRTQATHSAKVVSYVSYFDPTRTPPSSSLTSPPPQKQPRTAKTREKRQLTADELRAHALNHPQPVKKHRIDWNSARAQDLLRRLSPSYVRKGKRIVKHRVPPQELMDEKGRLLAPLFRAFASTENSKKDEKKDDNFKGTGSGGTPMLKRREGAGIFFGSIKDNIVNVNSDGDDDEDGGDMKDRADTEDRDMSIDYIEHFIPQVEKFASIAEELAKATATATKEDVI